VELSRKIILFRASQSYPVFEGFRGSYFLEVRDGQTTDDIISYAALVPRGLIPSSFLDFRSVSCLGNRGDLLPQEVCASLQSAEGFTSTIIA
jgi:hypothetical protein